MSNLMYSIRKQPVEQLEIMSFNPKWMLAVVGNGSRYWIHPDSGTVVTIVEK